MRLLHLSVACCTSRWPAEPLGNPTRLSVPPGVSELAPRPLVFRCTSRCPAAHVSVPPVRRNTSRSVACCAFRWPAEPLGGLPNLLVTQRVTQPASRCPPVFRTSLGGLWCSGAPLGVLLHVSVPSASDHLLFAPFGGLPNLSVPLKYLNIVKLIYC